MFRLFIFAIVISFSLNTYSQEQFTCNDSFYQVFGNTGQLLEYDIDTNTSIVQPFSEGRSINAVGYRTSDNYAYGIFVRAPFELVRLGSDAVTANLGVVDGLPAMNFPTGDFSAVDGLLYIYQAREPYINTFFGINVDTAIVENEVFIPGPEFAAIDMAFNPRDQRFYTIVVAGEITPFTLIAIDMETATVEEIGPTGLPQNAEMASMFSDAAGRIYAQDRNSPNGDLYELNTVTGEASLIGGTVVNNETRGGVDGFYCFLNRGPEILEAVPTLSEWGLIAMAAVLGIAGFMVIRRRKVSA